MAPTSQQQSPRFIIQPAPLSARTQKNGGVDLASQQLTAEVNQILTSFSVVKARRQLSETSEEEWQNRGEKRALALFHAAGEQRSYPGSS